MKTIAEILRSCEVDDQLTNGNMKWTVAERYYEGTELIVIATPHTANADKFEIWSCGTEVYSHMPGLKKI